MASFNFISKISVFLKRNCNNTYLLSTHLPSLMNLLTLVKFYEYWINGLKVIFREIYIHDIFVIYDMGDIYVIHDTYDIYK